MKNLLMYNNFIHCIWDTHTEDHDIPYHTGI